MRIRRFAACLFATALLAFAGFGTALADEGGNPCVPTSEQLAAYEADGTLAQRQSFQDALGNDQPNPNLIAQALDRHQRTTNTATASNANGGWWTQSMASVGRAHVLGLRVTFPDEEHDPAAQFAPGDTLAAFEALLNPASAGGSTAFAPYENLGDYYYRASHGRLSLTGEAFDYTAQHERAYYDHDIEALFLEALAALDGEIDYTRFDVNGDGGIDCVYLHFTAPDPQWGTTWWSNEAEYGGSETFDGVHLRSHVTLHNPCDDQWGAQTIIHETGHVLGLPDLYSYAAQQGGQTGRTGPLTFDMMNDNLGDHNALFKWMLGWIDDADVTYLSLDENGAEVRQGSQTVATYTADEAAAGIERTVAAFAHDDPATRGKALVVSNDPLENGLFGSYYLLQYEHYAGNQRVNYDPGIGASSPLPSGFRAYRVQADLMPDNNGFLRTNTAGQVHNQLIELVDPDMGAAHARTSSFVIEKAAGDTYGCLYYGGDSLTPEGSFVGGAATPNTRATTNFHENALVGFTGISFAFAEADGAEGTVRVSYSDDGKPAIPTDFSLENVSGHDLKNIDTLTFKMSAPAELTSDYALGATLVLPWESDQVERPFIHRMNTSVDRDTNTVNLKVHLDAGRLQPGADCSIIFPAGMFVIGSSGGQDVPSPELVVPLKVDARISPAATQPFANVTYEPSTPRVSVIATGSSGTSHFVQYDTIDERFLLHTLADDDAAHVTTQPIEGLPALSAEELDRTTIELAAAETEGEMLVALTQGWFGDDARCYWIDETTAELVREEAMSSTEADALLRQLRGKPSSEGFGLAIAPEQVIIDSASSAHGYAFLLATYDTDGGPTAYTIIALDCDKAEIARTSFTASSVNQWYESVSLNDNGAVAVSTPYYSEGGSSDVSRRSTRFFDENLDYLSELITASNTTGAWLPDGRWANTAKPILPPGPLGSPQETASDGEAAGAASATTNESPSGLGDTQQSKAAENTARADFDDAEPLREPLYYVLTEPMGKDEGGGDDEPVDPTPDPETPPASDDRNEGATTTDDETLAQTNDPLLVVALPLGIVAVAAAILIGVAVWRMRR